MRRIAWVLPAAAALVCGCGAGSPAPQATGQSPSSAPVIPPQRVGRSPSQPESLRGFG